nr:hypothetical protein [Tanacetum cinerariifolium]
MGVWYSKNFRVLGDLRFKFFSKNYVKKFLRALHPKWRAKVTTIEESKDLTTLSLDELIENLKVHEMIIKKDFKIVKEKVKRKYIALKAKKESSDEECSTFGSEDEEYAMATFQRSRDDKNDKSDRKYFRCGDPNHLIGECPKPPKDKNQRAFVGGSWSDSGEEDDENVKDKMCLVAHASSEVTPKNSKAYIVLNKHTKKVKESLNVIFDETPPPSKTSPLVDDDLDEEEAIKVVEKKNLENDIVDETLEIDKIVNIKESRNHPLENIIGNINQRTLRNKLDENGIVSRNKARLVAQGYNQQDGIDYDENYALVARLESIRILLAYACVLDFKLFQMDVKSAFLNGFINEDVYVAQPLGISPVAIIDRQLPFENTITSRSTDVVVDLKSMFEKQVEVVRLEKQARVERFDLIQTFHACKQEEGKPIAAYVLQMKRYVDQPERLGYMLPQDLIVGLILSRLTKDFSGFGRNFNMYNIRKTTGELHDMLIEYEKGLPKKAETPQVMMIKGDKILKSKKKSLKAKGKGKANGERNNKQVYIPKPKNPKPATKEHPAKDDTYHHCKEVGHWKRNCYVYLAELLKEKKQVGSASSSCIFIIELFAFPNKSWVYDTGCGVVSVHRLVENRFVKCFTNFRISVSKNNVHYFNVIPSNDIYEIDMHDLVPNFNSIYNVSTKRAKHNLDSTYLWHCRLAHISKKCIEKLQPEGLLRSTDDELFDQFMSFLSGKMTRKSFPHRPGRVTDLLGIIHTDHKHEVFETFKVFKNKVENQLGKTIKALRSDRGGEYISQEFKDYLKACGIVRQLTPPYAPQHNGVSERRNRTLLDMVRSMINHTTLPLSFWDSALESATRILNMVPTKKVDKTPYELWYGKVPNLSYLKVWGCEALVKRDTPDKLQQRSVKYAEFFDKNLITQEVSGRAVDFEEVQDKDTSHLEITSEIPMEVEGFEPPQEEVILIRRSERTHQAPNRLCLNVEVEEHNNMVWVLVDLPPNCKTIGSKCIFKKKTDMDGMGYTQLYEVDYKETFSPVAGIRVIRILISVAAFYDYEIWKIDVKIAFLNGYLDEDIYMKSSKQSTTAMSATEAEYIAASEAAMKAVWIRKFISGFGIVPTINEPIRMFCDNSAALHFANEPGVQRGARHYHRRYHYVRKSIALGEIRFFKVHTYDNLTDPFTKALSKRKLTQHAKRMRLRLASSFMMRMEVLLGIHGVWDVVDPGSDDAKKNNIVKGLLFQSIPEDLVMQIGNLKNGKEMWEAIKTRNLGDDRVKEARLQTLITEFKNLKMLDNDSIDAYAAKLSGIAFKSATLGEVMSELKLVKENQEKDKIGSKPGKNRKRGESEKSQKQLQSVEEVKLKKTRKEGPEMQSHTSFMKERRDVVERLKAYEERVKEEDKANDPRDNFLYARIEYSNGNDDSSGGRGRGSYSRGCGRGRGQGRGRGNSQNQGQRDSSQNHEDNEQKRKQHEKRDLSYIQCYRCDQYGHFVSKCPERNRNHEVNLNEAQEKCVYHKEGMFFMMNHIQETIFMNEEKHTPPKSELNIDDEDDVCNVISLGQATISGYVISIRGDFLTMRDSWGSLLIKVPRDKNRLYKAQRKVGKEGTNEVGRESDEDVNLHSSSVNVHNPVHETSLESKEDNSRRDDTPNPLVRLETIRVLIALAARKGWKIHHLDMITDFLNGDRKKLDSTLEEMGFYNACTKRRSIGRLIGLYS